MIVEAPPLPQCDGGFVFDGQYFCGTLSDVFMSKYFILTLMLPIFLSSCSDDEEPVVENEEEVITEVVYRLEPTDGSEIVQLVFSDPDGDGGADPITQVTGSLTANMTYSGSIIMTDRSQPNTTIDITAEIGEEDEAHQLFYIVSTGLDADITYSDSDSDGNPTGLLTEVTAGGFSSGTITIILRHELDKSADGLAIDNPDPAGGTTDIEVAFPVSIGG